MSQHPPDIDRLISLYLCRRSSKKEKQELEQWLSASSDNREMFERLKEIWSMSSSQTYPTNQEQVRDRIWSEGTGEQKGLGAPVLRWKGLFFWGKVAAVFFLFLSGTWLFSQLAKENTAVPEEVAWIEKVNPAGQRSRHRLPDGSKVWLNAESSFKYPENFTDTVRLVQLTGEAFFEVAKDKQRPFVVEAADTRTLALGTAFNIQAYPEDLTVKVALLEGKVRVQNRNQIQNAVLAPGEELLAFKDNSQFVKQQYAYESTLGWKEGILLFDGADFAGFRNTIEKWYGVKLEVKGTAPDDWAIRARYQREDLKHVLQDVSFNKNIKFEMKDKNVLIIF